MGLRGCNGTPSVASFLIAASIELADIFTSGVAPVSGPLDDHAELTVASFEPPGRALTFLYLAVGAGQAIGAPYQALSHAGVSGFRRFEQDPFQVAPYLAVAIGRGGSLAMRVLKG